MSVKKINIGMVGVGSISGIYLKNITGAFQNIQLLGVCDLVREKAEAAVAEYPGLKLYETMHDIFADPEIDIVLNLTRPYEHFDVSLAALKAGKHVYSEKPLAATLEEGRALVAKAQEAGLLLGGAPDTFLGAGLQTCRKLIDDGFIGEPVGAAAFMVCHGHESWHPDPAFYYQHGGGPLMDMGPYYLTALVSLLGGVSTVAGMAKKSFPQRTITSQPNFGQVVEVKVPTYVTGLLQFDSGAIGTIFTTFDVHYDASARLEIYGSKGTLICPDPNTFDGPIKLLRPEQGTYQEMPLLFGHRENSRALGLADMADALQSNRALRAGYEQTLHVLEIIESLVESGRQQAFLPIVSKYERPLPMQDGLAADPFMPV